MARLLAIAGIVVAAVLAVPPERALAVNFPVPFCNGGGCGGGWYRSSVTVTWVIDPGATSAPGCSPTTISSDTGGENITCSASYPGGTVSASVTVKKDSSPPGVTASASRGPDSGEWYTKAVGFSFTGDDGASGVASCTSATYSGPDGGAVSVSGSCTDNAGNTGSASMTIKYDATPPAVTATPTRPPDANGWYNHPVQVAFAGTDAGSGVKECSPTVDYKGPDVSPAKLVGQCRDNAGLLSEPVTFELRYDGTAPARPTVKLDRTGNGVRLSWTPGKDVVKAEVVEAPGLRSTSASVVFTGKSKRFVDTRAKPSVRYWYEVRLYDQAGNRAARTVGRKPAEGVYAPADGAVLRGPPLVEWAKVPKARFYNVQLWRGRQKLLTTWLRSTKLKLRPTWSLSGEAAAAPPGRLHRASSGPRSGRRSAPQYGKLLGKVRFVVRL